MSLNPETCSHCGTENPPDQDFCIECGQPLSRSAEQGLRSQQSAQDEGGVYGVGDDIGADEPIVGGVASPRTPHRGS